MSLQGGINFTNDTPGGANDRTYTEQPSLRYGGNPYDDDNPDPYDRDNPKPKKSGSYEPLLKRSPMCCKKCKNGKFKHQCDDTQKGGKLSYDGTNCVYATISDCQLNKRSKPGNLKGKRVKKKSKNRTMGRIEKIKRELIEEANKRILGEYFKEEPVIDREDSSLEYVFLFEEGVGNKPFMSWGNNIGGASLGWSRDPNENEIIGRIVDKLRSQLRIVDRFKGGEFEDQLKGIIQLSSQSSSSGGDTANANVGQERWIMWKIWFLRH